MGGIRYMAKVIALALLYGAVQAAFASMGLSRGGAKVAAFVVAFLTSPIWSLWLNGAPTAADPAPAAREEA